MNTGPFRVSSWVIVFFSCCAGALAQTPDADRIVAQLAEKLNAAKIGSGVIVTSVGKGSAGEQAGMRVGDLVTKVNDESIFDTAALATVRDRLRGSPVTFTVWRNGNYLTLPPIVLPSALNISGVDWSNIMFQILFELDANQSDSAAALFSRAVGEHLLSRKNELTARLLLLGNDPLTPESEQTKITKELVDLVTANECIAIARTLNSHGRPWSALPFQRKLVQDQPNNVSHRLNLGLLLANLLQNDEASATVNFLLEQPRPNLSGYGFYIAENVLATVATNREDWKDAFAHHARGLAHRPQFDTEAEAAGAALRHTYLAARLDDLDLFRTARQHAAAVGGPTFEISRWQSLVDALEAHVLMTTKHQEDARIIVAKWAGKPEWQLTYDYWVKSYPPCARDWKSLSSH